MTAQADASPALPLLLDLEHLGCRVELTPDRLIVEPASRLTAEQRRGVLTHASELALVYARRDVMRAQLDAAPAGRVPALLFRPDVPYVEGRCFSCGDALHRFRVGRCWRCALAWRLAAHVPIAPDLAEALDGARVSG